MILECPLCKQTVNNEIALIEHYNSKHGSSQQEAPFQPGNGAVADGYRAGDRVLAMWIGAMWQYFPATVVRKMSDGQYEINWDDGDTSGKFAFDSKNY